MGTYMVSSGIYSDYRVKALLRGPDTLDAATRARMAKRYAEIEAGIEEDRDAYLEGKTDVYPEVDVRWMNALIAEFGFERLDFEEFHDGQSLSRAEGGADRG